MRSGRIRSALRTSWRIVTSPRPSTFAGRASRRTTCGWRSRSSAASSIVTIRSSARHERRERVERRRLARAGPAADEDAAARARTARASRSRSGGAHVPAATRSSALKPARAEAADREHRPVERQRRDDDVHARAVGQPRVAQRLGLVDATPERREDALDRVAQLGLAGEAHVGALEPPGALDPHRPRPVDHHLVDRGVAQQRLERARARTTARPPAPTSASRAAASSSAASRSTSARIRPSTSPAPSRRRLDQQPLAQGGGERVEVGDRLHTTSSPRAANLSPAFRSGATSRGPARARGSTRQPPFPRSPLRRAPRRRGPARRDRARTPRRRRCTS